MVGKWESEGCVESEKKQREVQLLNEKDTAEESEV